MLLKVKDLNVSYGKIRAIKGISLEVNAGEVVTLIGANGAGKTTFLKTISGILSPASGEITYDGKPLESIKPFQRVNEGICQAPEGRGIFPGMTVLENLEMGKFGRKVSKEETQEDLDKMFGLFPRLKERASQMGGTLSGGEQQMLAIGRALMSRPRLLLLDEPSMGLAPKFIAQIFEIFKEIKENKKHNIYALTNWSAETFPKALQIFEFLHWFDGRVVSGEEMTRKPFKDIYEIILSRFGLQPETTLFIDDNLKNIIAAKELGIHCIHFQSPEKLREELLKETVL
jgi:branched-chain amino acid transport system ATP-binding protein